MNVTGLIFLGAGYLLGNPAARDKVGVMLQQLAGQGIDTLSRMENVQPVQPTKPKE